MNLKLSTTLVATVLLFSYAKSSPVDMPKGIMDSDELEDMNKILKNADETKSMTKQMFLPHRDGDEAIFPVNLKDAPNLKYDVELLESADLRKDLDEVEERHRGAALHMDTDFFSDEDIEIHKLNNSDSISYVALMSVFTVFGLIVLIIYAVLITWRRKLEQRYGQRVLLVSRCDDEDFMQQLSTDDNSNSRQHP